MTDINFKVGSNWMNAALAIYKIGAIYMSVDSTSPATLFGGTWVALEGRMLIGANSTYGAGTTGGSKTTTLAIANLPAHNHSVGAHKHTVPQHGHGHTLTLPNHGHSMQKGWRITNKITSGGTAMFGNGTGAGIHGWNEDAIGAVTSYPSISGSVSDKAAFDTNNSTAFNSGNTGSGTAFDTISPYLAVYMWKRTA